MSIEQSRTPSLAEILRIAMDQRQAEIHVALPGRIESYDVNTQRADIKPLVQRPVVARDGTELETESLPVIMDVPINFPRGGGSLGQFFITWPLKKGDLVQLVFNEKSIDQFMASRGEEVDPKDFRMHNLSDAVAYPGFYPEKLALPDADPSNLAMGRSKGMQLHITPDDVAQFKINGVVDASVAVAEALKTYLDTSLKTWVLGHAHSGVTTGPGISGPPTNTPTYPAYDDDITSNSLKIKGN